MPAEAFRYFSEDIGRARAIHAHATSLIVPTVAPLLRDDLYRSAWMFAVAAFDAYLCDAFSYCLQHTLTLKSRHAGMVLPTSITNISNNLPSPRVRVHKFRDQCRAYMEKKSMQKMDIIGKQFANFTSPRGFFEPSNLDRVIADPVSNARVWGANHRAYLSRNPLVPADAVAMQAARDLCSSHCEAYFQDLIQRRHDCIHNCDRPNRVVRSITGVGVNKTLSDIETFIGEYDGWIARQFPVWLAQIGCPAVAIGGLPR